MCRRLTGIGREACRYAADVDDEATKHKPKSHGRATTLGFLIAHNVACSEKGATLDSNL